MSAWPRPVRPRAPIAVAAAVVTLFWFVAHNGGAGWVQFVGDLVFGTLLVGVVGPAVVAGRARVVIRDAPTDGVAGLPMEVHVVASSRLRVRPLHPPGDEAFIGPAKRTAHDDIVRITSPARGVHRALTFEVASAAPFALQWWGRRVTVPLPHALYVAPRRGRPEATRPTRREQEGAIVIHPHVEAGFPRGARPYVPGDARRRVHWRLTAHAGALMVKELERPSAQAVTVIVDLPPDPEEAEAAAGRALATVLELLDVGASVLLQTLEESGVVAEEVRGRRQAGRRMALAVSRGTIVPSAP
ncbi:MAG TPA: DUF58 domain-containing protein [Acidimicrobiales bacterium]|nr:DUF58 domain-containing protein [Acidimicrobiales bacterium]